MPLTASKVLDLYQQRTPKSLEMAKQARGLFPSGVTHDARHQLPYPIYVERAQGSRKWDVDGNEYVDYAGGHGALLLGHSHPAVTEAVQEQLQRGTHYGACHQLEMKWAERIQQLVPSASRVRFTSSGTEATLLALRLARAHTGKSKVLRFLGNFHGWQDHVAFGVGSHLDGTPSPGVLAEVAENVLLCPPGDMAAAGELLERREDIAAVILEPTGGSWGQIPIDPACLHELRELTEKRGVVLIFDEVISGFRCSPGGAQAEFGVTPDLTTLAKIVAGGLPGGALVGCSDIMGWLDHQAAAASGREKVAHQGTFNANPVSAAAGLSTLTLVAETDVCQRANDYAASLRQSLTEVLRDEGVPWTVYGTYSGVHIYTCPDRQPVSAEDLMAPQFDFRKIKQAAHSQAAAKLRLGMLVHGVEIFGWPGALTSAVHNEDDLERTADAFRSSLRLLKEDGDI